ncbi:hypothetical protein M405DRAFT_480670 [Rhizopogon salebrosus TDB-379]|nr:hypothetical protein M405DRAFT_480670 [Rhizopogon salebrosus TDB-379]
MICISLVKGGNLQPGQGTFGHTPVVTMQVITGESCDHRPERHKLKLMPCATMYQLHTCSCLPWTYTRQFSRGVHWALLWESFTGTRIAWWAAAVKRQPLEVRRISAIQSEGITGG